MQLAVSLMDKGGYQDSIRYFGVTVSYQSSLKTEIAEHCMKEANELMDNGKHQNAIKCFEGLASLQPSLKAEIAEICYKKGTDLLKGITQNTDSSTSETHSII